jgi:protein-tyrosine phosphatase
MPKHIEYLYIPAVDHESFDISQYFEASYTLLSEELPRTNVLVHCMAGVSRSATLVIAFLMRSRSLSFQQAFRLVKQKRKIVPQAAYRSVPTPPSSNSSRNTSAP